MTMSVFGFSKEDFIDAVDIARAATFLDFAVEADIQLLIKFSLRYSQNKQFNNEILLINL